MRCFSNIQEFLSHTRHRRCPQSNIYCLNSLSSEIMQNTRILGNVEHSRVLVVQKSVKASSFNSAHLPLRTLSNRQTRRDIITKASGENKGNTGKAPRAKWDFGRFVKTLWFFNGPPSPVGLVKRLFKEGESTRDQSSETMMTLVKSKSGAGGPIVMVAGGTGGVGKRVVSKLLEQGKHVRALVRDLDKAKSMYLDVCSEEFPESSCLELAPADITQRKTLLPEYFSGVKQLVWCAATKIVPKEGDDESRSKYYQGIKFYDPEVQGDTPETVEYQGMQNVLEALKTGLPKESGLEIFNPAAGKELMFGPIDDVVMGGVSSSTLSVSPLGGEKGGAAGIFAGNVTQANNGGFASVRSKNFSPSLDISAYDGFEIRLKGDGQRYKFIARTEDSFDGVGYTCSFDTSPGSWQTIRIPFTKLIPVFRSKTVMDRSPFVGESSHVSSLQFMLSKFEYDGKLNPSWREGPFELPIQYVRAYIENPSIPRVVMVSSAGVTRWNRPGINVDEEPPAVKMNDMLGGLLTYKLASEDALRDSGIPFSIVRPTALTEEPAGAEVLLDQGDTIKGKISRNDVAELCVSLLQQENMANMTFEIKSTIPFSTPWTEEDSASAPLRDWGKVLKEAKLQQGITGKTIDGVYKPVEPKAAP